jgi:hypothetical protein
MISYGTRGFCQPHVHVWHTSSYRMNRSNHDASCSAILEFNGMLGQRQPPKGEGRANMHGEIKFNETSSSTYPYGLPFRILGQRPELASVKKAPLCRYWTVPCAIHPVEMPVVDPSPRRNQNISPLRSWHANVRIFYCTGPHYHQGLVGSIIHNRRTESGQG